MMISFRIKVNGEIFDSDQKATLARRQLCRWAAENPVFVQELLPVSMIVASLIAILLYLVRTCQCALEYELLDPEAPFSERMYTTDDGDIYIIVYNPHDGSPMGVEPYFPASLRSPDEGCKQLYAHGFAHIFGLARYGPQFAMSDRVIHSSANDEFMGVFFRSRGINGREGLRFGCEALLRRLDGTPPWLPNTVKWFMSCDPARDQFRAVFFGTYPLSHGSCGPIDPEAEQKKLDEQKNQDRKRKAEDPDDEEAGRDRDWKFGRFRMKASGDWVQGQLMRYAKYSYQTHSMGEAYPAASHVMCKDVEL